MRIFAGMPCGENVVPQTAMCFSAMICETKLAAVVMSQDTYCDRNHNFLIQTAFEQKCDKMLFVDSDHEFPSSACDELIARGKDIVGCQYRMRQEPWPLMPDTDPDLHGCDEVEWLPSGMLLVDMSVFEKIPYPWFPNLYGKKFEDFVGSDRAFCRKAAGLGGYKIWCDFDLSDRITHITRVALRRDGTFHSPGQQVA